MKGYTLKKHLENIELLKKIYSIFQKSDNVNEMFTIINSLADFIQENEQYSFINVFNILADLIVDIINFCNSEEYSLNKFTFKYNNISNNIIDLIKEIIYTYPITVYFIGKDKYKLINNIINENIRFIRISKEYEINISKKPFTFNILVLSEETLSYEVDLKKFEKVIYYDKLMNDIFNIVERLYYKNYEYNYLVNAMNKAKSNITRGIFVGHSHPLRGINDDKIIGNMVNLSLPSQSLYYSIKIATEIINSNKNIKRCFIGTSYWSFYSDLSKTEYGKNKIEKIYYPILRDSHHYEYSTNTSLKDLIAFNDILIEIIFNAEYIYNAFTNLIYNINKTYFNNIVKRENYSALGGEKLLNLGYNEKLRLAKERADQHNKLIKHEETREENIKLINDFLIFLNERDIKAYIINFPTTRYYNNFLNKEFKIEYYNIINKLKKENNFYFFDLNNNNDFEDEDFVDMDHASDIGANKITNMLNEFIYS